MIAVSCRLPAFAALLVIAAPSSFFVTDLTGATYQGRRDRARAQAISTSRTAD